VVGKITDGPSTDGEADGEGRCRLGVGGRAVAGLASAGAAGDEGGGGDVRPSTMLPLAVAPATLSTSRLRCIPCTVTLGVFVSGYLNFRGVTSKRILSFRSIK
jgi:hypothetical protein